MGAESGPSSGGRLDGVERQVFGGEVASCCLAPLQSSRSLVLQKVIMMSISKVCNHGGIDICMTNSKKHDSGGAFCVCMSFNPFVL